MKKALVSLLLAIAPAAAQIQPAVFARTVNTPSISVAVQSLPNTAGGTIVNLSNAQVDWRLLTLPASTCQSHSECFADRRAGGAGLMGLHPNGGDGNYQKFDSGSAQTAIAFSYSDGTLASSGSGGYDAFFNSNDHTITAVADNSVLHTFTGYYVLMNAYNSAPAKTGDGTANFTISLSDGSVAPNLQTVQATAASGNGAFRLVIQYRSASDGRELSVRGAINSGLSDGNTVLVALGATLDGVQPYPVIRQIPMGADLQAEHNGMFRAGDTEMLPAGFTWAGNWQLSKSGYSVRVNGQNIPNGQRIKAAEARATITESIGTSAMNITGSNVSVDGIELATTFNGVYGGLLHVGPATYTNTLQLTDLPHDVDVGHMYVHCPKATLSGTTLTIPNNCRQGMIADGNRVNVHDSMIVDIVWQNVEANAISTAIGQNENFFNNELMGNGEVFIAYASGAYSGDTSALRSGLYPNNLTIQYNWLHKDLNWLHNGFQKNELEIKNGRNILIANNVIEYSFLGTSTDGQYGTGIAIANRSAGSYTPGGTDFSQSPTFFAATQNIVVRNNTLHHVANPFVVQGPYDDHLCYIVSSSCITSPEKFNLIQASSVPSTYGVQRAANWTFQDNFADDVNPIYSTFPGSNPLYSNRAACLLGPGADNFTFQRNQCVFSLPAVGSTVAAGTYAGFATPSHTVTTGDASGWDTQSAVFDYTTGTLIDSNDFGWEFHGTCTDGLLTLKGDGGPPPGCPGGPTSNYAHTTFTNNNIPNPTVSTWATDLATAAAATSSAQYAGNTFATATASQGPSTLAAMLAAEPAIRAGNR